MMDLRTLDTRIDYVVDQDARRTLGHRHNYETIDRVTRTMERAIATAMKTQAPLAPIESGLHVRREDASGIRARAADLGVAPDAIASKRFDGMWSLWSERVGERDTMLLRSGSVLNAPSLLASNLHVLVERERASHASGLSVDAEGLRARLMGEVNLWNETMKGRLTTKDTLTDHQIREVVAARKDLPELAEPALRGDPRARERCVGIVREDELEHRQAGLVTTWTMWLSQGHPEDRRLVVTRQPIDALAFHQLNPDARTRYISLDGADTPTRAATLERAVSLMPRGSVLTIATTVREVAQQARAVAGSRLAVEVSHKDWHHDLRVMQRQTPSDPQPFGSAALPRARASGDLGLGR